MKSYVGERKRVQVDCGGVSRTKESEKESCDINKIIAKYRKTGVVTHRKEYGGRYGDFSSVTDFHTAQNVVLAAQEMFMTLPSHIRKKFRNDPGEFLAFVDDPANVEEMIEMGLAVRKEAPADLEPGSGEKEAAPAGGRPPA